MPTTMSLLTWLPILPLISLFLISIFRTHLLMTLLALETTMLYLATLTVIFIPTQAHNFMMFILLTLAACEAALGLAVLTALSRSHGSDLVASLTINKC